MRKVYFPICLVCGDRPWSVDPRQVPVVCDGCGRLLDHFRVRLQRTEHTRAA